MSISLTPRSLDPVRLFSPLSQSFSADSLIEQPTERREDTRQVQRNRPFERFREMDDGLHGLSCDLERPRWARGSWSR